MSAHGFRSLFMAASVAGAALGCYLISLNVASERAELEAVEEKIVLAQRDIRVLQTEIGTRGRLAQLERWNVKFIRLSAPSADQFVEGGFQLATMVRPQRKPAIEAPVILAAAPSGQAQPLVTDDGAEASPSAIAKGTEPKELMHSISYTRPEPAQATQKPVGTATAKPPSAKPAPVKTAAVKPAKGASGDPLAPLPSGKPTAKGGASKKSPVAAKDDGTAQ